LAMQRALRPRIDHQIQAMAYKQRKAAEKAREKASAEASVQVDCEQKDGELLLLERLCESMTAAEETPSRLDLENEIIGLQVSRVRSLQALRVDMVIGSTGVPGSGIKRASQASLKFRRICESDFVVKVIWSLTRPTECTRERLRRNGKTCPRGARGERNS
jgi:hypothetical protein